MFGRMEEANYNKVPYLKNDRVSLKRNSTIQSAQGYNIIIEKEVSLPIDTLRVPEERSLDPEAG